MIGILAGMGPKSTGPFIDLVVEQCQSLYGAKDDLDFPPMMIYSCPTPFYVDRPLDHQALQQAIVAGAQRLAQTGVAFIAMPCNTAHLYFETIAAALSVPILNMIDETVRAIPPKVERVGLLATAATVDAGLYQAAFRQAGFQLVEGDEWQSLVTQTIVAIKQGRLVEAGRLWQRLSSAMAPHIDAAVVACTDLNVVVDAERSSLRLIDSATCLAKAVVQEYLRKRQAHGLGD